MIKEMLKAARIPGWPARCSDPPSGIYALYFDDEDTSPGPDPAAGVPRLVQHACMVELYEAKPDDKSVAAFEAQLDANGLHYTKQTRYWLKEIQRYQTIYEFTYYERRRA